MSKSSEPCLFVGFSADGSAAVASTEARYVYRELQSDAIPHVEPMEGGADFMVSNKASTLLVLVGIGTNQIKRPTMLQIRDIATHKVIATKEFPGKILKVCLNEHMMVVLRACTEGYNAHVFGIDKEADVVVNMDKPKRYAEDLHWIASNEHGIAALSNQNYLAIPKIEDKVTKMIGVVDLNTGRELVEYHLHNNFLGALAFSVDGYLASCSVFGTMVKVWYVDVKDRQLRLYCERRRSTKRAEKVHSLAFDMECVSEGNSRLLVASSNGTVHLFDVQKEIKQHWPGFETKAVGTFQPKIAGTTFCAMFGPVCAEETETFDVYVLGWNGTFVRHGLTGMLQLSFYEASCTVDGEEKIKHSGSILPQ